MPHSQCGWAKVFTIPLLPLACGFVKLRTVMEQTLVLKLMRESH